MKINRTGAVGVYGLQFATIFWPIVASTLCAELECVTSDPRIIMQGNSPSITNFTWFDCITGFIFTYAAGTGATTITDMYGLRVRAIAKSLTTLAITTAYGVRVEDWTGTSFTTVRLLEVGPATPYLRVVGKWTAAANQTPVYVSEGATPTLRQVRTFDPGVGGINFTAGQLVCVLV